ncbi:MAG: hypothetical protein IPP66_21280 [Anaerolineales bacterium]|nr:hypothetical protein [Anaerolineales bacterium]
MNTEKRNTKTFNIFSIVFLVAILLTIVGGVLIQRTGMASMVGERNVGRGHTFMQPYLMHTSPTGELAVTAGIILLIIGFVMTVVILLVRRNRLSHNPS